jgi:glycosyltransferase involved in cell wall biosynthesis
MNIVHVTHRAWPVAGGSERHVQEIARRQVLDGHQVTVIATDADDLSALWERRGRRVAADVPTVHQGVQIRRLPVRHLPLGWLTFPALRRIVWLSSRFSAAAAMSLARFSPWVPGLAVALREEPANLLFAWNVTLEGLTAAVAQQARRQGSPWIAVPLLHLGRPRFYTMRHQMSLLRQAAFVLAQTAYDQAFLLERGFAAERVRVVSPGVDAEATLGADGRRFRDKYGVQGPVLLTLGALGYDKGTLHLLAAAQKMWAEGRRLTVALAGPLDGSARRAVERLPAAQREHCRCLGWIAESDKWDALAAADIVALPSRTESFGIVFLEAWACGKPVIGARTGAVGAVIADGIDGLLVPFGDVAGLANALHTLLDDPRLAAEMGHRGREKVLSEYTWDRQYDRLRGVVEQVMEESKR